MKRSQFNRSVLDKCIRMLKSYDPCEVYEGVILATYLIEQSFKSELHKINPLLVFDRKSISDDAEVRIALKRMPVLDRAQQKTCTAKQCIAKMCEYKKELSNYESNLNELFKMRNIILHSMDALLIDENSAAETAVTALRNCRRYVVKQLGIRLSGFNPLTSKEFEIIVEKKQKKRRADLKVKIKVHKQIFKKMDKLEIARRIRANLPKLDNYTWIEETTKCLSCIQPALDKIGMVDFDWNPDGVLECGGYSYRCRVCDLMLSENEYEIAQLL